MIGKLIIATVVNLLKGLTKAVLSPIFKRILAGSSSVATEPASPALLVHHVRNLCHPSSKTQQQALDTLHILAKRRAVKIQLQPGDMIFFNNLSMLHARDAFVDEQCPGNKRHLLRLILKKKGRAHELPSQLAETWKQLYEHGAEEELLPIEMELFSRATEH